MRAFILELNTLEKSGWVENTTGLYYLVVALQPETHVRVSTPLEIFSTSKIANFLNNEF
jgi:hypothetical protein